MPRPAVKYPIIKGVIPPPAGTRKSGFVPTKGQGDPIPGKDKRKADVIREAFDAWQAGEYGEPARYGVSGDAAHAYIAAYLGRDARDATERRNTVKTIQRGFRKLLAK